MVGHRTDVVGDSLHFGLEIGVVVQGASVDSPGVVDRGAQEGNLVFFCLDLDLNITDDAGQLGVFGALSVDSTLDVGVLLSCFLLA